MKQLDFPEIPEQQRFTISEACALCLVEPHVLRYWEKLYKKLNKVSRQNNRRLYSREELILIRTINQLKHEGRTSDAIAEIIDNNKEITPVRAEIIEANKLRTELQSIIKLLD